MYVLNNSTISCAEDTLNNKQLYTVSHKQTCDYIFYNNCRWFYFPPHLSSATTLPWEITEHKK